MATYKRRIVYFSDEEWAAVTEEAARKRKSISAYLRAAVTDSRFVDSRVSGPHQKVVPLVTIFDDGEGGLMRKREPAFQAMTQADRDAILRKISTTRERK